MKKSHALFSFVLLTVLLTAGAAQSLAGSNTVYTDDIVNGNVTSADIHDGTVTGTDVKDSSITTADVAANSLTGADIRGTNLTYENTGDGASLAAGETKDFFADCRATIDRSLSGEYDAADASGNPVDGRIEVTANERTSGSDGWVFRITNTSSATVDISTWVVCIQF